MDQPILRFARIGFEDTAEITSATLLFPQPDFTGQRDERKCRCDALRVAVIRCG